MGGTQSSIEDKRKYMNEKFKEEFKNNLKKSNKEGYIAKLNGNMQPENYCIDAAIIRDFINCDTCKAINCKNCNYKRSKVYGGKKNKNNKKNNYTKQKSSYDMVKLKNELFRNNKQDKDKINKKFQNLLDNITMNIFGDDILKQDGGTKRKLTNLVSNRAGIHDYNIER